MNKGKLYALQNITDTD